MKKCIYCLVFVLIFVFSNIANARIETRKIYGTITKCGTPDIVLTNTSISTDFGQIVVATNYNGEYEITDLYPGFYDLVFSKNTYKEKTIQVYVDVNEDLNLDICLCQDIDFVFKTESPLNPVYHGDSFWKTIIAEGGCEPYEFSLEGSLPQGLNLNPETGLISGTIENNKDNIGNFSFIIKVKDNSGDVYTKNYSIEVYGDMEFVSESPLKSLIVGYPFRKKIAVSGGQRPYIFRIVSGQLPKGVVLTETGLLEGIPEKIGQSFFTVEVEDDSGRKIENGFLISVVEKLVITTNRLYDAVVDKVYNMQLSATGGAYGIYQWEIASRDIPGNMILDKDSGVFSGIPKEAEKIQITFMVTDSDGHTAKKTLPFHAVFPLNIKNLILDPGLLNETYSESIRVGGGIPPFYFSCSNNLPKNLSLDPSTGIISGTANEAVGIDLKIEVRDSSYPTQLIDSETVRIEIKEEFLFKSNSVLPDAIENIALDEIDDFVISLAGGVAPFDFDIINGSLPAGIDLNTGIQAVELIRTPITSGDFTFTLKATDSNGDSTEKKFFWHIIPQMLILTKKLNHAVIYEPYHMLLESKYGSPPYLWAITNGYLPEGLELKNENDVWTIEGIPREGANYLEIEFMVSDSHPVYPIIDYTTLKLSVIEKDLTITTNSLPEGKVNKAYKEEVEVALGLEPYSWTLSDGFLPAGLDWTVKNNNVWIEGKPEVSGVFPICFEVSDHSQYNTSVSKCLSILIHSNIEIVTEEFVEASRGKTFYQSIEILNDDDTVFCQLTDGRLPLGLELDSETCSISGTPEEDAHSESFCIKASRPGDFESFHQRCFSIILLEDDTLIIQTSFMRSNMQDREYFHVLKANGGTKDYHWYISSGYLPQGITWKKEDNELYFEGVAKQCGDFEFDVKIQDSSLVTRSVSKHYAMKIVCTKDGSDVTPPTPPQMHMSFPEKDEWSNGIITVLLLPGFDEESGISGYSYEWNTETTSSLDNTVEAPDEQITSPLLPNGENHYLHVRSVDNAGNASETVHFGPFKVIHPEGCIMIVGGGESTDPFWDITKTLTINAYSDFQAIGYKDEQIIYHIKSQMISIDLDEVPDDVVDDSTPTAHEIVDSIKEAENQVDENNRFILYLQGHGTEDARLRVDGVDEYITAEEIDVALDWLQTRTNCEIIVIVESCFSGNFIEPLAGEHRIILTSAGNERYKTDSLGRIAFSRYLLSKLREKKTLKEAFDYARMCMVNMGFPEPLIDDNGDGVSDDLDGLDSGRANKIILDVNGSFAGKPEFKYVDVKQINNANTYLAEAMLYTSDVMLKKPFIQILPPKNEIYNGDSLIEFQSITLESTTENKYESVINNLQQFASVKLVFYAINRLGEISDPVIFSVEGGNTFLMGDFNYDNNVDIEDAIIALKVLSGFKSDVIQTVSNTNNSKSIGLIDAIFVLNKLSKM
ncbi:transporter [Candidatus Magnetomorum sp. HK-1]|nr:transporter [Candidatus Magnetomorum sp. HK-1]